MILLFYLLLQAIITSCTEFSTTLPSVANSERVQVLNKHNQVRRDVAQGVLSTNTNLPKATNMYALVWDEALSKVASDYANTCPGSGNHNANRVSHTTAAVNAGYGNIDQYSASEGVGENMGFTSASYSVAQIISGLTAMLDNEADQYTYSTTFGSNCNPAGSCKHFTQGVWADTIYVGCGYIDNCGGTYQTQFVCNFYPAGNVAGQEIYSQCPSGGTCQNSPWCTCASCDGNGLCTPTASPTSAPTPPTTSPTASPYSFGECPPATSPMNMCNFPDHVLKTYSNTIGQPLPSTSVQQSITNAISEAVKDFYSNPITNLERWNTKAVVTYTSIDSNTFKVQTAVHFSFEDFTTYSGDTPSISMKTSEDPGLSLGSTILNKLPASAHSNSEQSISAPLIVVHDNDETSSVIGINMNEIHLILGFIIIVLITMCGMIIGFCYYVRKNKREQNNQETEMVYFENRNEDEYNTPIIETEQHQQSLKINVNGAATMVTKLPTTTPVSPLIDTDQNYE